MMTVEEKLIQSKTCAGFARLEFLKSNLVICTARLHFYAASGQSGVIVIDENGDRLNTFDIWTMGPGNTSYYPYVTVDLSQPIDKV
jgi:hypothetical protein